MGSPKALLRLPSGERLVDRALRVVAEAGLVPVVVGGAGLSSGDALGGDVVTSVRVIDDDAGAQARGPLAGLVALLDEAARQAESAVIVVACDMPSVPVSLLSRLVAYDAPEAIVAPRRGEHWEPLCARYEVARVAPRARARLAAGSLSLRGLFEEVGAAALPLEAGDEEALDDVDTVEQALRRGITGRGHPR